MEFQKILLLALLVSAGYLALSNLQQENQEGNLRNKTKQTFVKYQAWKEQYGKIYEGQEDKYRFKVFSENVDIIEKINEREGYEVSGINILAGLTNQEYRQMYLNPKSQEKQQIKHLAFQTVGENNTTHDKNAPTIVDWVAKKATTPVVSAGSCASSYAIGTSEAMASAYQLETGKLVELSAQQIVSCDNNSGGCRGGISIYSYLYAMQYGMQTAESYPYTSKNGIQGSCKYEAGQVEMKPSNTFKIQYSNGVAIQKYLTEQPLSAEVDASSDMFRFYRGGDKPLSSAFCYDEDTNYTVLMTGYNNEAEVPYWTVQASYGTSWGNEGFMLIKKKDTGMGVCGINKEVQFPTYSS